MIASLFAGLLFYLFPTLVGRSLIRLLNKRSSIAHPFVTYFISGSLLTYATTVLVYYIAQFAKIQIGFEYLFAGVIALLSFVFIPANVVIEKFDLKIKRFFLPVIASFGITLLTTILWRVKSPYPLNWDIYEHQTLANNILDGKFSFFSSQVTDTFGFNGYSTLFHTLLAASQTFFSVSVFDYWNSVSFVHLGLVCLASYLLAREVTGSRAVGYISMLLGGLIFDSTISFTNLFLIPQTFTACVFVLLFVQLIRSLKDGKNLPIPLLFVGSIFLLLNHYIVGSIAFFFYFGTYLYFKFQHLLTPRMDRKYAVAIGILITSIAILASGFIPLGSLNKGEGEAFVLGFIDKWNVLRQSYGLLPLIFFPIGIYTIIKRKTELALYALDVTLALSALVLFQLPYVVKFFVLDKYFFGVILAVGLYTILNRIKHIILRCLGYAALIFTLVFIFILNSANWKQILIYKNTQSHVSESEIKAAEFLKEVYSGTNTMIVSDPSTQYILETLSGVNSQGGAYMDHPSRDALSDISTQTENKAITDALFRIKDKVELDSDTRLFVLSGRYFVWQNQSETNKQDFSFNIWHTADLTESNKEYINTLISKNDQFRLVFQNETLAIIEVKKPNSDLK